MPASAGRSSLDGLRALSAGRASIGDVRGLGLMVALEFVKPGEGDGRVPNPELTKRVQQECFARNLLLLTAGTYVNVIRIIPPLVTTADEIDQALGIIARGAGRRRRVGQRRSSVRAERIGSAGRLRRRLGLDGGQRAGFSGQGASPQPAQDLRVQEPVRAHERRAVDAALAVHVRDLAAGLLDHHDRRRHVPCPRARLEHRLARALGHQGVAPEVAEAALAPGGRDQRVEPGHEARSRSSRGSTRTAPAHPPRQPPARRGCGRSPSTPRFQAPPPR